MVYYFPVQNSYLENFILVYALKYSKATECYVALTVNTFKRDWMLIFIFGEQIIYLHEKENLVVQFFLDQAIETYPWWGESFLYLSRGQPLKGWGQFNPSQNNLEEISVL